MRIRIKTTTRSDSSLIIINRYYSRWTKNSGQKLLLFREYPIKLISMVE